MLPAHGELGFLAGAVPGGGPTLEQPAPEGLLMERTHTGVFWKNCSLWEELMLDKFIRDGFLGDTPHAGGGECQEERAAEIKLCRLT